MTKKNAINWFEIPVSDYERAVTFYENILQCDLKREVMDGFDMAVFPADDVGVAGSLIKADFLQPGGQGCVIYLNVEGMMDGVLQRAQARQANVLFPKTHIGEPGYIAHIEDSEGNRIGLHSMAS